MIRKTLLALAAMLPVVAAAELTYPVDHTAQWQLIDITSCTTVGGPRAWPALDPDAWDCALGPCGKDPGYPAQFRMLKVAHAGPFPDYDSNLSLVQSPYLMCGPDTSTCYAAGCTATDTMQQVHTVVPLSKEARLEQLSNQASVALMEMIPDSERWRVLMLQVTMLSELVAGASLPTSYAGVNWAQLYADQKAQLTGAATPVAVRYSELAKRIQAGTIQDGEISTGWPTPAE